MVGRAASTAFGMALALAGLAAGAAPVEDEAAFLARCRAEILTEYPDAAAWVDGHCGVKRRWAEEAGPMAEALLASAPEPGAAPPPPGAMRARLTEVRWGAGGEGALGDLSVFLSGAGALSFGWSETGSEGRYNLIDALKGRGVSLRTLGCPQYPGASMGREKVMLAEAEGRAPFVLTVYSRPAPTGFEPALYQVDAEFGGVVPDMAALEAGRYPGGGGRAFAVDPTRWTADCEDPM